MTSPAQPPAVCHHPNFGTIRRIDQFPKENLAEIEHLIAAGDVRCVTYENVRYIPWQDISWYMAPGSEEWGPDVILNEDFTIAI